MVTAGYQKTEVGEIPEDWNVFSIGEITAQVRLGGNYPNNEVETDTPLIKMGNLGRGSMTVETLDYVPQNYRLDENHLLKHGDVLFNTRNTLDLVGKVSVWRDELPKAYYNSNILRFDFSKKLISSSYFVNYALNSYRSVCSLREIATGTTSVAAIYTRDLLGLKLAVPTAEEQKAIATALSDVDELIGSLETLIAKKRDIKTATMQQLLTGKTRLPGFGEGKGRKQTELGEIPEDWDVRTYGNTFSFLSTASNSRSDLSDVGDISYIHYGDIHTNIHFRLDLEKESLPKIDRSKFNKPIFIADGDVIMADASEDYDGIGKSIEVSNVGDRLVISGLHTFLLRDSEKHYAAGFRAYLHSIPAVKRAFDTLATGLKVYGLSKNSLKEVSIPVPPFDEQIEIVKVLESMSDELEILERRLSKTKALKQGMMQELLTGRTRLV